MKPQPNSTSLLIMDVEDQIRSLCQEAIFFSTGLVGLTKGLKPNGGSPVIGPTDIDDGFALVNRRFEVRVRDSIVT